MLEVDRNKSDIAGGHPVAGLQRGAAGKTVIGSMQHAARVQRPALGPEVAIRQAQDSDAAGLAHIVAAIMGEFPGCVFDLDADFPELKQPRSSFEAEGGRFWVAEWHACGGDDARRDIVGCCGFLPAEDAAGIELQRVYLRPEFRGSGLATKMFQIVQAVARQRQAGFIELWTDSRFKAAQRFYEKLGFVRQPGERLLNDRSRSSEYHYLLPLR
ncbi:MAG TPA: GNAT family N-acetyltransferase [Dongiaceae bacterium]|nr:GNAT family N-acetyltransferase [Dongiaceae bacterium]